MARSGVLRDLPLVTLDVTRIWKGIHMTTQNTKEELDGTTNPTIFFTMGDCSLGSILVAQSERGVCSILIGEDPARLAQDLQHQFPKAHLVARETDQEELVAQVAGFIEKPGAGLDLPLDV